MRQYGIELRNVTQFLLRYSKNVSHRVDIFYLIFSTATRALNFKLDLRTVTWVVCHVFIFTSLSLGLNINEGKIKKKKKSKCYKTPPAMLLESVIL